MLATPVAIVFVFVCSAWSANGSRSLSRVAHADRIPTSRILRVHAKRSPSPVEQDSGAPTPAPTGNSSPSTTVHITNDGDFALLLPKTPGGLISDAEEGAAVSFCYGSDSCANTMPDGFITGAHVSTGSSGTSQWTQVTGCIDPSKYQLSENDGGGQFDVRFPEGAQCTFGGYGASFIEQVEPSAFRFCLRCCSNPDDQTNCNSHHDTDGCLVAIPGVYSFDNGVSCDG